MRTRFTFVLLLWLGSPANAHDCSFLRKLVKPPAYSTSEDVNLFRARVKEVAVPAQLGPSNGFGDPRLTRIFNLGSPKGGWTSREEFLSATSGVFSEEQKYEAGRAWEAYDNARRQTKTPWIAPKEVYEQAGIHLTDKENDSYFWLSTKAWSPTINDFFMLGIVHSRKPVYATPMAKDDSGFHRFKHTDSNRSYRVPTTTAFELQQLLQMGWFSNGNNWYYPPEARKLTPVSR